VSHAHIRPTPTDEEAAAITAALAMLMERPGQTSDWRYPSPRWRWSGRWWSKPAIVRRERPW